MSINTNDTGEYRQAVFSFITIPSLHKPRFLSPKRTLIKALERHRCFDDGELLYTMEKGALFPVIHFLELFPDGNKPQTLLQDPSALGEEFTLQQGLYREIKHVSLNPTSFPTIATDGTVYRRLLIFTGFLKLDNQQSDILEETWKHWSGARLIYRYLKEGFGLTRISFWKRVTPGDLKMFMYVMIAQCETITAQNQVRLLDFAQRMRVDRMMGYLSLYRIEKLIPSTDNTINGLLTEAADSDKSNI